MCTALSFHGCGHYFGRTLDLEYSYGESITVTPRNFALCFRRSPPLTSHYAMIGVAFITCGYPLYYDAVNERGLAMAALNFPGSACYSPLQQSQHNVAPFELIPWVLAQCATVLEARRLLEQTCVIREDFSPQLSCTPLHWLIADKETCLVAEPLECGLRLHDNPVGVLTNEPPFDIQLFNLNNHLALSPFPPENRFSPRLRLSPYSRGMGALGLPGDFSSQSRFVRAAFISQNARRPTSQEESVTQFFHILGSVEQVRGCVRLEHADVCTVYTSCCDTQSQTYYYTTYENRQISAVALGREDVQSSSLSRYPLLTKQHLLLQN